MVLALGWGSACEGGGKVGRTHSGWFQIGGSRGPNAAKVASRRCPGELGYLGSWGRGRIWEIGQVSGSRKGSEKARSLMGRRDAKLEVSCGDRKRNWPLVGLLMCRVQGTRPHRIPSFQIPCTFRIPRQLPTQVLRTTAEWACGFRALGLVASLLCSRG